MTMPTSSRKWRTARWALVVAGAVGLVAPAPAQIGQLLPGRTTAQPAQTSTTRSGAPSEAQTALEQIKVELAWLSDPATFPWPLTARISGPVLHVTGEVPSQAVRQQALKIAGENCAVAVIDGIKINPTLVRSPGTGGNESLEKTASGHVHKYMAEQGKSIAVSARGNGQVTLTGTIGSHEEKLAVSQSLRAVKGCTGVVNQLRVAGVMQDGRPHATVSADGRLLVPDPNAVISSAIKHASYTTSHE